MKKLLAGIFLATLCVSGIFAQKTVLGTVEYKYVIKGEGAEQMASMMPNKTVINYGKESISIEMKGGMMASMMGKIVISGKSGEMFMVQEMSETVFILTAEEQEEIAAQTGEPSILKTNETMDVEGYPCTKYEVTSITQGIEVTQVIWATNKLQYPEYDTKLMQNGFSKDFIVQAIDGFPVKTVTTVPNTQITIETILSDFSSKKIKPTQFEKPNGYEEKPFSSLGMGF